MNTSRHVAHTWWRRYRIDTTRAPPPMSRADPTALYRDGVTDPTVRLATIDDIDRIVALATAAYRGTGDDAGWTTESHLLDGERTNVDEVTEAISGNRSAVLLAELDGATVGVIKVEQRGTDGAGFGLFAVDPTRQSGGTGSRLLDEAERIARDEWGRSWMQLEVLHQRADLQAWYRRRDYEPTGETQPFPYEDERFGLPKADDLVFDVYQRRLRP